jgi:iron complex transport system substrate-binding protein
MLRRPFPSRIVCLTEETTEALYLLGEQDRIAGVSGYTARPPEARQKPKVSAFTSAKIEKILAAEPDLVLGFSDLQAGIARDLISRGLNVIVFNQRSVEEIFDMIAALARLVDAREKGEALLLRLEDGLEAIRRSAARFPRRPRVLFEEWKDPLISGIRWVEELIEIAGGEPVFPELRRCAAGKDRIVNPATVPPRNPEVIIASWCGMKVNKDYIRARPGWGATPAVRGGHIYEIKSAFILQPGPAALTEGVRQLHAIVAHAAGCQPPPELMPEERIDADLAAALGQGPVTR